MSTCVTSPGKSAANVAAARKSLGLRNRRVAEILAAHQDRPIQGRVNKRGEYHPARGEIRERTRVIHAARRRVFHYPERIRIEKREPRFTMVSMTLQQRTIERCFIFCCRMS